MFATGWARRHGSSQPMVRWLITWVWPGQASAPVLILMMVPVMARGATVITVSSILSLSALFFLLFFSFFFLLLLLSFYDFISDDDVGLNVLRCQADILGANFIF